MRIQSGLIVQLRALATVGLIAGGAGLRQFPSVQLGARQARKDITFADIAPVVARHCVTCHRPNGMAPFSLLTYDDVKKHAAQIAKATESREMPPWLPEPGYGSFADERRLTPDEIGVFGRWVEAGAPEGLPSEVLSPSGPAEGWQLGEPDLIVSTGNPYTLPIGGTDVYRNFVIPIPVSETRYVRVVELRPDNPRVVHHARMLIDRTGVSRQLDEEDPEPGYDGMLVDEAQFPDGHFLGWSPGKLSSSEFDELPWVLERGTDLVVQMHLRPTTKPETIHAAVGFYFSDRKPERTPFVLALESKTIDIPPGQKNYRVEDSYVLPVDVEALRVYPHAHYLGTELKAFATLPDGSRRWLIWIKRWDFNHQDEYRYSEPVFLPKGSVLAMQFSYDNSADNPLNPSRPVRRVTYGPRASDEMGQLLLQVLPSDQKSLATIEGDFARKQLLTRTAGAEQMLRADPSNAALHRSLASCYLQTGKIDEAFTRAQESVRLAPDNPYGHTILGNALAALGRLGEAVGQYRAALRLKPSLAQAHNDLGVALQSLGRIDEAIGEYREALRLRPAQASAHNNLGNALAAKGKAEEAIDQYREALELDPASAEAHNNLGAAFQSSGKLDQAMSHYRLAVAISPDYAEAFNNLGTLLRRQEKLEEALECYRRALHLKPVYPEVQNNLGDVLLAQGQSDEAINHLREALRLRPDYALAHNNLGLALASKGRVDDAVEEYEKALHLKPDYAEAHCNLANAFASRGQLDDAAAHLHNALRLNPDYAEARGNLGVVFTLTGNFDEAIQQFREALRLKPDWPAPMAGLAWALATDPDKQASDANEAIRLAERAADMTAHRNAVIMDTLAAAYAAAGQFEQAVPTAEAALSLAINDKNTELSARVRQRIELYRQRKPYRDARGRAR
jgi:tetratricopeptide (TPR) repeat protein